MNYQNFSIEITGTAGDYRLSVYSSVTNDMLQGHFILPFPAGSLERIVREVDYMVEGSALSRDAGSGQTALKCPPGPPTISDLEDFGTRMFAALLPGPMLDCFRRSVAGTDDATGVRLQLNIEPPELATLPWELLFDPDDGDFLCLKPDLATVRFKTIVDRIGDEELGYVRRPLRISESFPILRTFLNSTSKVRSDESPSAFFHRWPWPDRDRMGRGWTTEDPAGEHHTGPPEGRLAHPPTSSDTGRSKTARRRWPSSQPMGSATTGLMLWG